MRHGADQRSREERVGQPQRDGGRRRPLPGRSRAAPPAAERPSAGGAARPAARPAATAASRSRPAGATAPPTPQCTLPSASAPANCRHIRHRTITSATARNSDATGQPFTRISAPSKLSGSYFKPNCSSQIAASAGFPNIRPVSQPNWCQTEPGGQRRADTHLTLCRSSLSHRSSSWSASGGGGGGPGGSAAARGFVGRAMPMMRSSKLAFCGRRATEEGEGGQRATEEGEGGQRARPRPRSRWPVRGMRRR